MIARLRRFAAVLAAGMMLAAGTMTFAPGAQALPMSSCTTTQNAVVAVDFGHWNGPIVRGCGATPTTGVDLLQSGGFAVTGTAQYGKAFVCRLGSGSFKHGTAYPTPDDESCAQTPSSDAYWSYWHADPGQNYWTYSKLGAASYHPKPGSVDYWQFGSTNQSGTSGAPSISPSALRSNTAGGSGSGGSGSGGNGSSRDGHGSGGGNGNRSRHGTTSGGTTSRLVHAGPTSPRGAAVSSSSTKKASSAATTARTAPTAPTSDGNSHSTTGSSANTVGRNGAQPRIVNGSPVAHDAASSTGGSAAPLIIGLVVVLLIGGGAGAMVLRRRSAAG